MVDEAYFEYLPAGGHDAGRLVAEGRAAGRDAHLQQGLRPGRASASATCSGPPTWCGPWAWCATSSTSARTAQAAAIASLAEADALLPERIALNTTERETMAAGMRELGLAPLPSEANFLLVDLGSPERAQAVNAALLARGVIVRPARAFGAPSALRVTVGFPEENARFLDAAAGALAEAA